MREIFALLVFAIINTTVYSQVLINEFQAENDNTIEDPEYGKSADWVELFNKGTEAVDLTGYYFTDNEDDTTKWEIPFATTIGSGEYLLLWCDGENSGLHTNFKLDKRGDEIALFSADKQLLDIINFSEMKADVSFGRTSGGGDTWVKLASPSPGEANVDEGSEILKAPEALFNVKSGFYSSAQTIELTATLPNATIYYSTDGSVPDENSSVYVGPITIEENSVVKALVVHPDYAKSRVAMNTYFIGERMSDLPVVSLGVDPYDFFDEENGLYMPGPGNEKENTLIADPNINANFWRDIELPVTFELFIGGDRKTSVNAGVRIFGNYSRRFEQKSMSINCRDEWGDERMRYKIFPDKDNDVYKQIVLRNAGSWIRELKYRDLMLQNLIKDGMDIDYQAGRPAIVYINGEYWGILNIREKLQERWVKDNYGIDEDKINLGEGWSYPIHGTISDFQYLYDEASYEPVDDLIYSNISGLLDIDEYINYNIAQIFINNHDWPGNNVKYWSEDVTVSKWRFLLWDLDQSFEYYSNAGVDVNTLEIATYEFGEGWPNPPESTSMLRNMLEYKPFSNMFVQQFCAQMNSTFSQENLLKVLSEYETMYEKEKPYHMERWGGNDEMWNEQYDEMVNFATFRQDNMKSFLSQYFNLKGTASLTIKSAIATEPSYEICNTYFAGKEISGEYFTNISFRVRALPPAGYKFKHWLDSDGNIISRNQKLNIVLAENKTIEAVFEETGTLSNIYINEVIADNKTINIDSRGEREDLIELYNANDFAVNIAGLAITDNIDNPLKYIIPEGKNGETVIPAKGHIVLFADSDEAQGALHVDIKLSSEGETIGLSQSIGSSVNWLDTLAYTSLGEDESFGRFQEEEDNVGILPKATIGTWNGEPIVSVKSEKYINVENQLLVYPTVANDYINIYVDNAEFSEIVVVSPLGQEVKKVDNQFQKNIAVYVGDLTPGIYNVFAKCVNGNCAQKIIVK